MFLYLPFQSLYIYILREKQFFTGLRSLLVLRTSVGFVPHVLLGPFELLLPVVNLGLILLLFQGVCHYRVLLAKFISQVAQVGKPRSGFRHTNLNRNDRLLCLIKHLEVLQSFLVMLDLVGQQALHSISEDVLGDSEVERTIGWVAVYGPMEKVKAWHLHLVLQKFVRNVNVLTVHGHCFLK